MRTKIIKLFIFLFIFVFVFVTNEKQIDAAENLDAFHKEAAACGFDIDEDFEPIYMENDTVEFDYYHRNVKGDRHYTAYYQVLVRSKSNPEIYAFVYKIITSPYQLRNWGFCGIGSYGNNYFNYDIKTNVTFPYNKESIEILDYYPKNSPSKSTTSIGVGLDSSGPSISASVSYDHSELTVISNTRTADDLYNTYFKIRGTSNYVKGEMHSYGMLMFRSSGVVWMDVKHQIQYEQQVGWDKTTDLGYVEFNCSY